jgi:hypothetical protein
MDEDFRNQIYNNLNLRETDDLIEIWHQNDLTEWTDVALDVVREILQNRLGELPTEEDFEEVEPEAEEEPSEALAAPPMEDLAKPARKLLVCPSCKGRHTSVRAVELRNNPSAKVVLTKRGIPLERFLGIEEYDEIVGVACEDCGFVFFMLKSFV